MRRNLLKLFTAAFCLYGTGVFAQGTWEAPKVPGVDLDKATDANAIYYMYNVKTDAFATNGMDHNRKALVSKMTNGDVAASIPQQCKITKQDDGTIKITINGINYLGGDGANKGATACWADQANNHDKYIYNETTEGSYVYTLKESTATVSEDFNLDVAWNYGGPITFANGKNFTEWAFIPEVSITDGSYALYKARKNMYEIYEAVSSTTLTEEQKTALETANAAYVAQDATAASVNAATAVLLKAIATTLPQKAQVNASTLFTNADMRASASNADWTTTTSKISWGEFECYHAPIVLTQTQTGLPNGLYTVVFHSFYRQDGTDAAPTLTLASGSNSSSANIPSMGDIDFGVANGSGNNGNWKGAGNTKPNGMESAGQALGHDQTVAKIENFLVENGELTITAEVKSSMQWFNYQGFDIYYQVEDLDLLKASLSEAINSLKALSGQKMNTAVAASVTEALSAAENVQETADAYKQAITQVNNAIEAATRSASAYADLATALDYTDTRIALIPETADKTAYTEMKAAYENGTLTDEEAAEGMAAYNALATVAKGQAYAPGTDYTYAILNNSFETGNLTGWNVAEYSNDTGVKSTNDATYSMDGSDGEYLFNTWSKGVELSQTVTGLPEGVYRLSFRYASDANCKLALTVNGTLAATYTAQNKAQAAEVEQFVTVGKDGTLSFSVKEGQNNNWYKVDNFQLKAFSKSDLSNIVTNIQNKDLTTNVGTEAFKKPQGLADAITKAQEEAQTLLANENVTADELYSALNKLQQAVAAFDNATLNAPAADQVFNIEITTADNYGLKNLPLTLQQGGGTFYLGRDANFYAQNLMLKQVEGNLYTVSTIFADGKEYYLCTAQTIGTGNNNQIRVTDDASKALRIEIVASATEGVYNLKNTEANALLGCQDPDTKDGGIYTTTSHSDFAIIETQKPSVTLTTAAEWATLILPFNAEIPNGLEVYSCAGTETEGEDAILTLETVETIAANTPYIVKAAANFTHTFEGFGCAETTTYTAGMLTGTFTEMKAVEGTYVLQNQDGKVGFYKVETEKPIVKANRAYLNAEAAPAGSNVQAFILKGIDGDGTTTGIDGTVAEADATVNVYNLNGILVRQNVKMSEALDGLQKGIYIVNGTKKAVK